MPIISRIGRRSTGTRLLVAVIYFLLLIGSVTMIYPFWLMIAGTTQTNADGWDDTLIPRFYYRDDAIYRKTVAALFNESLNELRVAYNLSPKAAAHFAFLEAPDTEREAYVNAWRDFLEETRPDFHNYILGHSQVQSSRGTFPYYLRAFKNTMYELYDGDLDRMNVDTGTEFSSWTGFLIREAGSLHRRSMPNTRLKFMNEWYSFKGMSPLSARAYPTAAGYYLHNFLQPQYSDRIANYNAAHGTDYAAYEDVPLPRRFPADATESVRRDWEHFVRGTLNLLFIRLDRDAAPDYREFLRARHGGIETLNRAYGTEYASFDEILPVDVVPFDGPVFVDRGAYIQGWTDPADGRVHQAPIESLSIMTVEFAFQDWLLARHGTLAAVNEACGTDFADPTEIFPPQREFHHREILAQKNMWRREFTARNFIAVADYVFLHGRAMRNTVIYCGLAVLCALIVNPLAAYALSRFRPPSTYKILLFLMMTMSFPPTVTQIPNFLLLREAGLLNTFAALILPGLANGYQIFLLKGFFDSLPREIYESAQLDGAGEVRMFWQFTMSLSKPILAVIALGAFTGAYGNFMMALLICQDSNMWTLMPWLYQLQMTSCQSVVYASLLIASLPTFVVFVFAQNVIMRGIVVPVEK